MTLRTRAFLFTGFVLLVCAANLNVLRALFVFSRSDASASHIVLIPLVSLALMLRRRDVIFSSVSTEWGPGLSVVVAALVAAVALRLFRRFTVPQIELSVLVGAVLVSWIGGFLLFFGWRALSAARFAMAFLAFTIPMPQVLVDGATELLKRGSAEAVAALFTLTATPYHREGFVFSLPYFSIEVADACSGIRSSIALVLTALLAGDMFLKTTWKKVLLVVAVVPLVIIKNGVRIVSLSLLATYVNPSFLVGRLHHDGGIVFFLLALMLLLPPVLAILRRSDGAVDHEQRETSILVKP